MFNQGRFNLLRFNLRTEQTDDIFLTANMYAELNAMVVHGGDLYETMFAASVTQGAFEGAAASKIVAQIGAEVHATATGHVLYRYQAQMDAALQGSARASLDVYPVAQIGGEIEGSFITSANTYYSGSFRTDVEGAAALSSDFYARPMLIFANFNAQAATIRFGYGYAEFDVELPPGATLVIDSNGYVVLLDGVSAIHVHSGDWLHLNRDTYDVEFEPLAGPSTMDAAILYTERWL